MSASASARLQRISAAMATSIQVSTVAGEDTWIDSITKMPEAPADPILGTAILFRQDPNPVKINLGIGAYRDNDGKPYVLKAVRKAEEIIAKDTKSDHEYLPIEGYQPFIDSARELLFGKDRPALKEGRITTVQTLSGTGALRVGAEFVAQWFPGHSVYVSNPTWGNHQTVFERSRIPHKAYRYWDAQKRGLNIEGMLADIRAAPARSIILLHGCAHNPTGVDPTREQWKQIADVVREKNHLAFFDVAYQGFATGDLEADAWSLRYFVDQGLPVVVCQSFAKNFGLYSERAGSFSVVCPNKKVAGVVLSQLKMIIRPMYSNPPAHGAKIVATVLTSPALYADWDQEMRGMSERIKTCRQLLVDELRALKTPGDWSHITSQIGMFSYTGLSVPQCRAMIKDWHVYLLENGRISMAGVNTKNVKHLAKAIDHVVRNVQQ